MGVSRFSNIGMSNTFQILRLFLPLQNPVGFTLPDAVLFGVAALALACILLRDQLAQSLRALARHPGRAAAMLVTLPIALRLALLPHHPIPAPAVSDDFAYLLAKTLDENRAALRWTHMPLSYDNRTVFKNGDMPLHPGAERYYREVAYIRN